MTNLWSLHIYKAKLYINIDGTGMRVSSFCLGTFNYFHHFRGDPVLKNQNMQKGRAGCWELGEK